MTSIVFTHVGNGANHRVLNLVNINSSHYINKQWIFDGFSTLLLPPFQLDKQVQWILGDIQFFLVGIISSCTTMTAATTIRLVLWFKMFLEEMI